MRSIEFAGQCYEVEILSLTRPRGAGLMSRGQPLIGEEAHVTMLSPVELPITAAVVLHNAEQDDFNVRVLGCAPHDDGRFVVIGAVLD
jgi:hypothetical protein